MSVVVIVIALPLRNRARNAPNVSGTVTLELQKFEFPEPSVAPQETLVVPSGKVDPDAGQLVEAIPQLSLASRQHSLL